MKTLAILLTGTAALALAGCAQETPDEDTDVTVVEQPAATETTVVREADDADSVTVDEDGVSVDVDGGGASVQADEDGASVTVSE